jgi:hypothetical protein
MRAASLFRHAICATLATFTLAGCVADGDPQTATQTSALTDSSVSVNWNPEIGCGPPKRESTVPCDGNLLWPAGQGITSMQVLLRKGPRGSAGETFLAFVVWNGQTVGRILRAPVSTRSGAHLRATIGNISTARTITFGDGSASSAGNISGGKPVPEPGPNVDDLLQFSPGYLDATRHAARAILEAEKQFLDFDE